MILFPNYLVFSVIFPQTPPILSYSVAYHHIFNSDFRKSDQQNTPY